jgi:hypothetical protein
MRKKRESRERCGGKTLARGSGTGRKEQLKPRLGRRPEACMFLCQIRDRIRPSQNKNQKKSVQGKREIYCRIKILEKLRYSD